MRRRVVIYASLLLLVSGALAGCGQKGPLFLPTRTAAPSAASTGAPAGSGAQPAPAATLAAPASAPSSDD